MSEQAQHVNGTAPTAPPADDTAGPEVVSTGERILGGLALIVAIGVALIAIDLISGGRAWEQWLPGRGAVEGAE